MYFGQADLPLALIVAQLACQMPAARGFSLLGANTLLGGRTPQLRATASARTSRPFLRSVTCQVSPLPGSSVLTT